MKEFAANSLTKSVFDSAIFVQKLNSYNLVVPEKPTLKVLDSLAVHSLQKGMHAYTGMAYCCVEVRVACLCARKQLVVCANNQIVSLSDIIFMLTF